MSMHNSGEGVRCAPPYAAYHLAVAAGLLLPTTGGVHADGGGGVPRLL